MMLVYLSLVTRMNRRSRPAQGRRVFMEDLRLSKCIALTIINILKIIFVNKSFPLTSLVHQWQAF